MVPNLRTLVCSNSSRWSLSSLSTTISSSIETISGGSETHVYDSLDWAHPPYEDYSPALSLAAGDRIEWTCTWNNTTGSPVNAGETSEDEMCIAYTFLAP